ncbi:Long-chain-fatty-acid--CoA ligase [Bacillus cereus]|nr:Long-chain-fatty-acid--CoA ligase [Bacillus cereus]
MQADLLVHYTAETNIVSPLPTSASKFGDCIALFCNNFCIVLK